MSRIMVCYPCNFSFKSNSGRCPECGKYATRDEILEGEK